MKANKININHKYLLPFLHHLIMTVRCLSHAKTHIDDLQFIVFYWWYYANFTFIYNKLYQLFICKVKALFAAQSTSTLLKFAGIHMNQFLVYFFSQIIYPALSGFMFLQCTLSSVLSLLGHTLPQNEISHNMLNLVI